MGIMQVVRWCQEKDIGLVLVGPEAPLVAGLVDSLKQTGIRYLHFSGSTSHPSTQGQQTKSKAWSESQRPCKDD